MVQIAPSILSANFAHLAASCRQVLWDGQNLLHIDVMDGSFVPNLTIGPPVLRSLTAAIPDAWYDVHLMTQNPANLVQPFARAGAKAITFHVEAEDAPLERTGAIRAAGCRAGISLRPGTPLEEIFPLLDSLDQVLIMSVEPGFGGQMFLPDALPRIAALKSEILRRGLAVLIQVDGGINAETAGACVRAGADMLVAGSAVFNAPDPAAALRALAAAL